MQQLRTSLLLTSQSDELIRLQLSLGRESHVHRNTLCCAYARRVIEFLAPLFLLSLFLSVSSRRFRTQIINPTISFCARGKRAETECVCRNERTGRERRSSEEKGRFVICSGGGNRIFPAFLLSPRYPLSFIDSRYCPCASIERKLRSCGILFRSSVCKCGYRRL